MTVSPTKSLQAAQFVCRYCHRVFVHEHRYLAHKCNLMKREEELKSPTGQAALHYYQLWMRTMKRMPPPAAAFGTSKFFRTFINFVAFSKAVDLPTPEKFIWFMVEKNFPPTIWTNDEVYTLYLDFLDHKTTPLEQVKVSMDTLFAYADKEQIDVSQVFTKLHPSDIIHMLRVRKVSPWLLLLSKKFKEMFVTKTNAEQKIIIETLIQPDRWMIKMSEHKKEVDRIKLLVQELGI